MHKLDYKAMVLLSGLIVMGCSEAENTAPTEVPVVCNNNGTCDAGETESNCPADCTKKQEGKFCGDGVCDLNESITSCPADCKPVCGNGICEKSGGESFDNCKEDCDRPAACGDGICDGQSGETTKTCSLDCKEKVSCGDGTCSAGETRANCPVDCPPVCGDGHCEEPEENETRCPDDCLDIIEDYQSVCGDGVCDDDENEASCSADCGKPVIDLPEQLKQLTMQEFNALTESNYRFLYDYDRVVTPSSPVAGETAHEKTARLMEDFFAFPFPSEIRTDQYGRTNIKNYPLPPNNGVLSVISGVPVLKGFADIIPAIVDRVQSERAGFSPIAASYFRTNVSIDTKNFPSPEETLKKDSCYQMINVEPESSHYGEQVPLYITYHRGASTMWAPNTLVLRPVPGFGAHPGDRYVTVVTNCLTSNGRKFNMSNKLRYILEKAAPKEINDRMEFYVDQLHALESNGKLGFKLADIRAMTGYKIMNVAAEMDQIAEDLKGRGHIVTDSNGVAVGTWLTQTKYRNTERLNVDVFQGQFVTANYVEGNYPYVKDGEGEIRFDEYGKLVSKPKEETINFSIVVPRTTMPAKGWPIAVYGHGTGGDADTHCAYENDEGIVLINGGMPGYGAKPLPTAVPMAMIGFDAHLQGKRGGGEISSTVDLLMMVLKNPVAIRESWRQTVIDMLVLYDIIGKGKLVLPPAPANPKKNVTFDPSYGMYMGHSQGSQEAGLLLGLTGDIKNAFLSAAGGGILISFTDLHPDLSNVAVVGPMLKGKSAADIVGFVLGLQDGDLSYDSFITNHIVQAVVEPIDPLSFTHRFILEPPKGWEPKNIAQTIGLGDQDTPQGAQFAMVTAEGLDPIGKIFEVAEPYRIAGKTVSKGSFVQNNVQTRDGRTATGGSMQFKYTGDDNPHFVIYRMDSARMAYVNFFKSVLDNNVKVSVSGSQNGSN